MPRYRAVVDGTTTFSTIAVAYLDADGTPSHRCLVVEPGDIVDLADPVDTPLLELVVDQPAEPAPNTQADTTPAPAQEA